MLWPIAKYDVNMGDAEVWPNQTSVRDSLISCPAAEVTLLRRSNPRTWIDAGPAA